MVGKFQSLEAITKQIADGWEYYIVREDGHDLGYTGLVPDRQISKLQLSKLYILASARGKGVGVRLLNFIEQKCREEGFTTLWLTVNRFNTDPIAWYKKRGFVTVDEVKMDIGNGFVMDDYIMEKTIGGLKENVH